MTDVRLTATNPEDSSVVPVACNAKGELLLEEPTLASDDYVAVTGDNMTGDLTLGTNDKIALDATDGGASFAGGLFIGPDGENITIIPGGLSTNSGIGINANNIIDGANAGLKLQDTTNGNKTVSRLNWDGSAEFSGRITGSSADLGSLSVPNNTGDNKAELMENGYFRVQRTSITNTFIEGIYDSAIKFQVTAGGKAFFADDVIVSSRNKAWMLVEQNGLCHMVEQLRATTADLVEPVAAEYPPLRDVFAELDAIEKALGEVMDKLRMAPPAGWEVWDGSSENS